MTRGTNLVRQSKTTIKFHGSRVAAFHLWVLQVCLVPFDKQDRHAALGEIDGKGLPDRTCADDKNVGIEGARFVSKGSTQQLTLLPASSNRFQTKPRRWHRIKLRQARKPQMLPGQADE